MPEKLKLIERITKETGLWFAAIGFLVAMVGGGLAFLVASSLGYWIGVAGVLIGFLGIVIHFLMNWREIFRVDR